LHRVCLLRERVDEEGEQFVRVLNDTRIFANDPNKRGFGFGLVELVEIGTEGGDDTFVS